MPYLKLTLASENRALEFRSAPVRVGRDPAAEVVIAGGGDATRVVSGRHAEFRHGGDGWRLADVGSTNGTFLNGRRLAAEAPVKGGDEISLGQHGPRIKILATAEAPAIEATIAEHPAFDPSTPPPGAPAAAAAPAREPEVRPYGVTLIHTASGKRFEATGSRIRIGRGSECEVQPVAGDDQTVSRVHAELTVGPNGGLALCDVGSRNGTFLNNEVVKAPVPVRLGDRIMLGPDGPVLVLEGIGTAPATPAVRPAGGSGLGQQTVMGLINSALVQAKAERQRGGRGSTAFLRAVAQEVGKDSGRKIRWLTTAIVILVLLSGGAVYGVYWLLSGEVKQSEAQQRSSADSSRSEAERLRQELEAARSSAAPAAVVDSLRSQLESAQSRTTELRAALDRAQTSLTQQLAQGESRRVEAQQQVDRLRQQLAAAQQSAPSAAALDSLRHAVAAAETQAASLDARVRALRGTDFAAIAQQSQGSVGLITVSFANDYYNGTGFVISPDGYMLTNWHVVADSAHEHPDTIWVTLADQTLARFADVVVTSRDRDIALIKIRNYQGPHLTAIDWTGAKARQGEPAGLIGYPAGAGFARLRSTVIRTSMTAGIISRVNEDVIQFDGMTIGGSSGSPVFNADGEVISIHRAGLPQAPGFALSVPIRHAIPLLPAALRQELGLPAAPTP